VEKDMKEDEDGERREVIKRCRRRRPSSNPNTNKNNDDKDREERHFYEMRDQDWELTDQRR
jgi:predicted Fe-S protein YdhL (DUF1289 family)